MKAILIPVITMCCCHGVMAFAVSTRSRETKRDVRLLLADASKAMISKNNLLDSKTQPSKMFDDSVYDTILQGKIAVVPSFLPNSLVEDLRNDAVGLYREGHFSADALAAYGTEATTKFDPTRDRTVLKLNQWKRTDIGNPKLRHDIFGSVMAKVRSDLSTNLDRPHLDQGVSTTGYGIGSTEISYTRFGPGAYLKRHIDEHHEELKGRRGWEKPTRRSISWLIYLNENDWDPDLHGGCIRCFQRRDHVSDHAVVGSRPNGDLQIGWLRSTKADPSERPVFMDGRRHLDDNDGETNGYCAMYILQDEKPVYITKNFNPDPVLFLAGGDLLAQRLLIDAPHLAPRFHFLEPPKSAATALLKKATTPSQPEKDEASLDIPPLGGTLVMFDSVSLPHEVLPAQGRERWATSGWFHEDQQEPHHVMV